MFQSTKKRMLKILLILFLIFGSLGIIDFVSPATSGDTSNQIYTHLIKETKNGYIQFHPQTKSNHKALIFYQGAKVPAKSYSYIAEEFTKRGYTVFFSDFFLHYAFFNINLAQTIIDENTDISEFILSGHSLGGAMIGKFISQNQNNKITHLIFLASYSADNISSVRQNVLSLSAEFDGNTTREKIEKYKYNLPKQTQFIEIADGNHRQFGDYTTQKGDRDARLSAIEQQQETLKIMQHFLES